MPTIKKTKYPGRGTKKKLNAVANKMFFETKHSQKSK